MAMTLQGAAEGKRSIVSEPFTVYVVEGDNVREERARFRFIPPRIEHVCRAVAEYYWRAMLGPTRQPTADMVDDEQHLLLMSWAIRKDDGVYKDRVYEFPSVLLADGVTLIERDEDFYKRVRDCDVHMKCPNAVDLWMDYDVFRRNEFPPVASDAQLVQILEDAKKKPVLTLLSQLGFWPLVRLLRGLESALRASSAPGSGSAG